MIAVFKEIGGKPSGWSFGPIRFDVDLLDTSIFLFDRGKRLRFFGVNFPWFSVGVIRSVGKDAP